MCGPPGIPDSRSIPDSNGAAIDCTELIEGRRWICQCPEGTVHVTASAPPGPGPELDPTNDFEDTELGGVLVECVYDDPDTFTIIDPPAPGTANAPRDGILYMMCYDE